MKVRKGSAIIFSGVVWMGAGLSLLIKGFSLLLERSSYDLGFLLPRLMNVTADKEQASLVLVSIGLLLGFLKGRLVLSKAANRVITRILSFENLVDVRSMYAPSYIAIIGSMIFLGFAIRFFPIPYDIRGVIDVAIGSALANGSAFYFRHFARRKA